MPRSTTLIRSRKVLRTMLGRCRPPDHKRKLQSESWRVGITAISPLVSYRPCVTYSLVPFSFPRPLNSLSPRIYSIFCLADFPYSLLRPWFHTTNASSTSMIVPSFLGPSWPARPGHLHPFVRRLTKEIPPWFDPFNEFAPTSSSLIQHQPFAGGRRQTSRIQRAFDRLHPAIWLFGHFSLPTLAQRSELFGYPQRSVCRYIHGIPPNGPNLCL